MGTCDEQLAPNLFRKRIDPPPGSYSDFMRVGMVDGLYSIEPNLTTGTTEDGFYLRGFGGGSF